MQLCATQFKSNWKMKMCTKLKMLIVGVIFISSSAHAGLFSERVDLKKIPQAVMESSEFTASPEPKLKEVRYSDKVISIEGNAENAAVVDEKLSYIKFSGNSPESASVNEKLKSALRLSKKPSEESLPVSMEQYGTRTYTLGGLFTLGVVNSEVTSRTFNTKAVSKAVNEIKGIDGALFPLKVGNALFFSYTWLNDPEKYGITLEVTAKTSAQLFVKEHPEIKELNLIGDIYVINQELKSTNDNFHNEPCEFYYADELSYVIGSTCTDREQWVKSYKLNKVGISYRAEVEELNKAKDKEEADKKRQISEQLTPEIKAKSKEKFTQAFNLFKEGEFEAAVIRFNQALEIDPANGLGHYYLAETYARLNDLENSMIHYNYTVLFSPDIKEAAIAEVKILKIKETLNKSSN
jgi:tetratricopeptide (TPR) repeat protein